MLSFQKGKAVHASAGLVWMTQFIPEYKIGGRPFAIATCHSVSAVWVITQWK